MVKRSRHTFFPLSEIVICSGDGVPDSFCDYFNSFAVITHPKMTWAPGSNLGKTSAS